MALGKIYIISAHIFKNNIYKVGRSRNFPNRIKSYKTAFGSEPIVHLEIDVNHDELIEKLIHIKLKKFRFRDSNNKLSREHYEITLSELIKKINEIIDYVGNDDIQDDLDEYNDENEDNEEHDE